MPMQMRVFTIASSEDCAAPMTRETAPGPRGAQQTGAIAIAAMYPTQNGGGEVRDAAKRRAPRPRGLASARAVPTI